jgi:hypothetical protein
MFHFDLMPVNFLSLHPSQSSSYQVNIIIILNHLFKLFLWSWLLVIHLWYRIILGSKHRQLIEQESIYLLSLLWFSLYSWCSEPALTEGKHDFHSHSYVCPWQVSFSFCRTGWAGGGPFDNSGWQVFHLPVCVCTLAQYNHLSISGCGGIMFHGTRFLLKLSQVLACQPNTL